jgi:hypothetical protein
VNPPAVSALEASTAPVRDSEKALPSSTGPLLPNVAVGAALLMVTVAV